MTEDLTNEWSEASRKETLGWIPLSGKCLEKRYQGEVEGWILWNIAMKEWLAVLNQCWKVTALVNTFYANGLVWFTEPIKDWEMGKVFSLISGALYLLFLLFVYFSL